MAHGINVFALICGIVLLIPGIAMIAEGFGRTSVYESVKVVFGLAFCCFAGAALGWAFRPSPLFMGLLILGAALYLYAFIRRLFPGGQFDSSYLTDCAAHFWNEWIMPIIRFELWGWPWW